MGVDLQALRFLFAAKQAGVDFSRTMTIGRQNLALHPDDFQREARRFGLPSLTDRTGLVYSSFPYADGLFFCLGASVLKAIDASDYEGADIILDMNKCVAPELRGQFSLIFDGGSLEHIYDVPQCIKNIVSMLEVSGHLISINGANNFMGHGFYQFSPEFFFRVFSSENGFSVDELVLSEVNRDATWYSATDPAMARQRVELVNNYPTYIMVRALKRKPVDALSVTPQQSDYELKMWSEGSMHLKGNTVAHLRIGRFRRLIPRIARRFLRAAIATLRDPYNKTYLKPRALTGEGPEE